MEDCLHTTYFLTSLRYLMAISLTIQVLGGTMITHINLKKNITETIKAYLPEFIELHLKAQNYRSNQIKKSKNALIILLLTKYIKKLTHHY